jgi:hemolysin III
MLSKFRQPVSGLTHLAGAVSAIAGQAVLFTMSGSQIYEKISLLVYSASLFLMFFASSIYHLIRSTPRVTGLLRKLDHAAIYLLIAGTYTPFCIYAFTGFWKWGLLANIWSLAAAGIAVKVWVIRAPRWVTAGVYVVMGWLIVFAFGEIIVTLTPGTITWLVIGGLTYTLGAVVYITKRMNFIPEVFGFHEIWHIFVMLGAAAHFAAVYSMLQVIQG